MTAVAGFCDAEGRIAVVARAARFPVPHRIHANDIFSRLRHKQVRVTFAATIHAGMYVVTEGNIAGTVFGEGDVAGRVATGAL